MQTEDRPFTEIVRNLPERFTDSRFREDWHRVHRHLAHLEKRVRDDPQRAFSFSADGSARLVVGDRAGARSAGRFSTPSIAALRRRAAGGSTEPSRLSLLLGAHPRFDIGTLQGAAPEGTLFQVASQLNCLEAPGPGIVPVSEYVHDPTQGPRASVSAFPGTLLRHYAAPRDGGTRFVQRNGGPQIDLLADALPAEVGRVDGGYLHGASVRDPAALAPTLEERFEHIRIGAHDAVEVAYGWDWGGPVAEPAPRIGQVLTSTLALGGYSTATGELVAACRPLLRAAYLGTLLAADCFDRRRVVLTMIGGGVFGNPHPTIWEAIVWSLREADRLIHAPLDVVVNLRDGLRELAPEAVEAEIRRRGGDIVHATDVCSR